jgi:hypothetical protein
MSSGGRWTSSNISVELVYQEGRVKCKIRNADKYRPELRTALGDIFEPVYYSLARRQAAATDF